VGRAVSGAHRRKAGRDGGGKRPGGDAKFNPLAVPRVVFTDPPVAAVGLREEDMIRGGIGCRCRVVPVDAVAAAWTKG
jgi:mercuric reductase